MGIYTGHKTVARIGWFRSRMGSNETRCGGRTRANAGFTLIEMLAALAVTMLLTAMVAMGVTMAMSTYRQSIFESESSILSDTIDSALSDPFRAMTYTKAEGSSVKTYSIIYRDDAQNSTIVDPSVVAIDGHLYIQGSNTTGNGIALLNGGAYTDCVVSSVSLTSCTDALVSGTYTIQSTLDTSATRTCSFTYVPMFPVQKTATS